MLNQPYNIPKKKILPTLAGGLAKGVGEEGPNLIMTWLKLKNPKLFMTAEEKAKEAYTKALTDEAIERTKALSEAESRKRVEAQIEIDKAAKIEKIKTDEQIRLEDIAETRPSVQAKTASELASANLTNKQLEWYDKKTQQDFDKITQEIKESKAATAKLNKDVDLSDEEIELKRKEQQLSETRNKLESQRIDIEDKKFKWDKQKDYLDSIAKWAMWEGDKEFARQTLRWKYAADNFINKSDMYKMRLQNATYWLMMYADKKDPAYLSYYNQDVNQLNKLVREGGDFGGVDLPNYIGTTRREGRIGSRRQVPTGEIEPEPGQHIEWERINPSSTLPDMDVPNLLDDMMEKLKKIAPDLFK